MAPPLTSLSIIHTPSFLLTRIRCPDYPCDEIGGPGPHPSQDIAGVQDHAWHHYPLPCEDNCLTQHSTLSALASINLTFAADIFSTITAACSGQSAAVTCNLDPTCQHGWIFRYKFLEVKILLPADFLDCLFHYRTRELPLYGYEFPLQHNSSTFCIKCVRLYPPLQLT